MKKISGKTINNVLTIAFAVVIVGAFALRPIMKKYGDTGIRPLPSPKYKEIEQKELEPLAEKYEIERKEKEKQEKQSTYQIPQEDIEGNAKKIASVKFSKLTKAGTASNEIDLTKKAQEDPVTEEKAKSKYLPPKKKTTSTKKQTVTEKTTSNKVETKQQETTRQQTYDPFSTIIASNENTQLNSGPDKKKRYKAIIYGRQEIGNNSAVEIKLLEDVNYNGLDLHYNSRLSGQAVFSGERVIIDISSVRTTNGEYFISAKVFDNDGIEGLKYKSGVEKNLEKDKDNLISRVARKSHTYEGEMIGELADQVNESIVNENLKPLKKDNYPVYVSF